MTMASEIKTSFPATEYAREFMRLAKETSQSEATDKSHTEALMSRLITMKYDGSHGMYEHVTEMSNITTRIRNMGMSVDENFLVQFVINSLPSQFSQFQINYNTIKDKWTMTRLQTKLVQEVERLKKQGVHLVNLVGSSRVKKKFNKKYGKGKRPLKIEESSAQIRKKDKTKEKCHFCKKVGHYMRDCLKRK
ncbi:hypothetical protein Patl1_11492 [Pistacia atlantica]|uniref:Uncharacterized protein n=1 Tax=Pistacia atlantica TaxID=434234 RepID=A0ACC1A8W4_9ROSI|nr:hypothetical protein Patl1_11492 [Pistacia atlantica]